MRAHWAIAGALLLAACGEPERREGDLSADEEQQLNDAAVMLDKSSGDLEADDVPVAQLTKPGEGE